MLNLFDLKVKFIIIFKVKNKFNTKGLKMIEITKPTLTNEEIKKAMEKQKEKDIKTFENIEKREKIVKKSKKIKKQKIIGTQEYINKETGEIIETTVIEKNVEQDYNFHKIWLLDLFNILELVGTKKMKVINYLFKIMDTKNNTISITYKEIQEKLGISKPVIVETFKILLESNFLIKVRPSFYMINPDLIVKGRSNKRINLLIKYNNIKMEKS